MITSAPIYCLVSLSVIGFGNIGAENDLCFCKFSLNILDVFFQGQTLVWPYLRDGWSD